jgi:putative ABC transport system ATP-binding protein
MSHDSPAPSPNILVARKLVKTYSPSRSRAAERGGVRTSALRGLDLRVARGEFVAVTGPSGSGKSTLLHLMAGLERPDSGSIWLEGRRIDELSETRRAALRRHHIGVVFQFFNLLDDMSALENVVLPAVIAGATRRRAESRARDLLDLLGLGEKAAEDPSVLSGGQRQRLAIARALANEPTVLLADEPTGALDSDGGAEIVELFRRLHRTAQTILLVTHDAAVAGSAGRVVHMRDGCVVVTEHDGVDAPRAPTTAG